MTKVLFPLTTYPCGTMATTKIGTIKGMITAITIRCNNVIYELTYYHDGEMRTTWLSEMEIDFVNEPIKKNIGFV